MIPLVIVWSVNDEEFLARAVVSSAEEKVCRLGGAVPASVFTHHGYFKISVDRVDRMTSGQAVRHGEIIASLRGATRSFYGWALLKRPDVLDEGCGCRLRPTSDNFWHAEILMPEDAAHDSGLHEDRASRLARRSSWKDRAEA